MSFFYNWYRFVSMVVLLAVASLPLMQEVNAGIKSKPKTVPEEQESGESSQETLKNNAATVTPKSNILDNRIDSSAFYKGDYVIGVGDSVMVSVWRNPDLSITVPVRPDGKISTPLVGDIQAAGRSPMILAGALKDKLARFIRDPQVSVIMTGLNSHEYVSRVRITGAVGGPTSVPHRMGMTVMDLILAAGGLSEFANGNRTVLYRTTNDGAQKTIKIKADDIWEKGKLKTNYLLRPGDVVSVPESIF